MKQTIPFVALACALAAASPAAAQDELPPRGTSVSLGVGGGLTAGLWRDVSPRVRAGVEVGGRLDLLEDDGEEESLSTLSVQPALKLFSRADGPLRPYTLVGVFVDRTRQRRSSEEFDAENVYTYTEAGARLGVGLEWAPVSRVTVGGHVGVQGGRVTREQTSTSSPEDAEMNGWSVGTFSSGLVLHLFF